MSEPCWFVTYERYSNQVDEWDFCFEYASTEKNGYGILQSIEHLRQYGCKYRNEKLYRAELIP